MFSIVNSGSTTIRGLFLQATGSSTQANVMVDIDQGSSGTYGSGTCTDTSVDRVSFNASTASSSLVGIRIAYNSPANCEQMRLTRNSFLFGGTNNGIPSNLSRGIAIKVGDSVTGGGANAKNIQVEKNYWLGVRYGVDSYLGVISAKDNESNFAAIDYKFVNCYESHIKSHYSESQQQFLTLSGGTVVMESNRIGNGGWNNSIPIVQVTANSRLTSVGNAFSTDSNVQAFEGGYLTALTSINDDLPNGDHTGYTTFDRGYTAIGGSAQPNSMAGISLNAPIQFDLSTTSSRNYKQVLGYDEINSRLLLGDTGLPINIVGGVAAPFAIGTTPNSSDSLRVQGGIRIGDVASGFSYSLARNGSNGNLEFDGTQSGYIGYHFKSGNVGINTAPSSNALEVSGTASATALSLGGGVTWTKGTGVPAGSCTTGSFYSRTGGGAGIPAMYVCENSGWVAK